MKILLRTEGLPGAPIFTEVERDDVPDEIIMKYSDPRSLLSANKEVKFIKSGYADGFNYYKQRR